MGVLFRAPLSGPELCLFWFGAMEKTQGSATTANLGPWPLGIDTSSPKRRIPIQAREILLASRFLSPTSVPNDSFYA